MNYTDWENGTIKIMTAHEGTVRPAITLFRSPAGDYDFDKFQAVKFTLLPCAILMTTFVFTMTHRVPRSSFRIHLHDNNVAEK